jgi:type IX secretion system PorP/SprF family membrane protein
MRRIVTGLVVLVYAHAAAQQQPQYTQYILNQYILNPALTGIENYTDIKVSHRQQWAGLQGAPATSYLTVHTPIGKKDYRTTATSFSVPGENPRGNQYWQDYKAAEPHSGIGLQVINDRTGPLNELSAYVTYAYHIGISPRTSLAAGFGAGIKELSLHADMLQFYSPVDPAVYNTGVLNTIRPDFTAGLYLYSADYFAGLSVQQIIPQRISYSKNTVSADQGKLLPHVFASAGYRFMAGEDFNVIPSVMVKYIQPLPAQVDLNIKLQYLDFAWAGLSYRTGDGFAAMVGYNLSNTVNLGYSYDYSTSRLNMVSSGTHEIILGFTLGNKYDDGCPKNVW